jgi:hypothetical protein
MQIFVGNHINAGIYIFNPTILARIQVRAPILLVQCYYYIDVVLLAAQADVH